MNPFIFLLVVRLSHSYRLFTSVYASSHAPENRVSMLAFDISRLEVIYKAGRSLGECGFPLVADFGRENNSERMKDMEWLWSRSVTTDS